MILQNPELIIVFTKALCEIKQLENCAGGAHWRSCKRVMVIDGDSLRIGVLTDYASLQVQDHVGDMQLRHEGHLLVPARSGALPVQDSQRRECPSARAHLR
jgi:hypothetical protein